MNRLRDLFIEIAAGYLRTPDMSGPAQIALREGSRKTLSPLVPLGFTVDGSGGQGVRALVPWIAILNPDVTKSAQEGIYVVYLFASDMQSLYLTLAQGVRQFERQHGAGKETLSRLQGQASRIRDLIADDAGGLLSQIELGKGKLPIQYEASVIVAQQYETLNLPSDSQMEEDLARFIELYDLAVERKAQALLRDPEGWIEGVAADKAPLSRSERIIPKPAGRQLDLSQFSSKADTLVEWKQPEQRREATRRHASVLNHLSHTLERDGWLARDNSEIDLFAEKSGQLSLLIEVKVVSGSDGERKAVREAIAQLLDYDHYYGPQLPPRQLVAAFSRPLKGAYESRYSSLLAKLGIKVISYSNGQWVVIEAIPTT